jgi:hypothetical protein
MTDISIILPYYKRIRAFAKALSYNHERFLSTPERSTEVVLVLDEPSEEEAVLELVQKCGQISWRVIINRQDHTWRNPAVAINVGIRHAKGGFVVILSPESICVTDVPTLLYEAANRTQSAFAIGQVHHCAREIIKTKGPASAYEEGEPKRFYGSICTARAALESIRGYDESNRSWGADDDNVRARLILNGLTAKWIGGAKVLHPLEPDEVKREVRRLEKDSREHDEYVFPQLAIANGENWGREFDEVIYDQVGAS